MKTILTVGLLFITMCGIAQSNATKVHVNHTAIYVMNLAKSGEFYSKIIGLDSIAEPFHDGKHIWYKTAEHTMLHVIQGADVKKDYYKNQHTCFTVPNFANFLQQLNAAHWTYEDKEGNKNKVTNRVDGVHQVWIQDPDGYWIEINDDQF
jgi:lactoylglutathione lyase